MSRQKSPVQVYLDRHDRTVLEHLARRLGLSRAETIREALRRWGAELSGDHDPVLELIGSIDDPTLPTDLSTRHDDHAVAGYPGKRTGSGSDPREAF